MRVLLLQLDGSTPNLALMRIAAHHHDRGDDVELRHAPTLGSVQPQLWDRHDRVYASLIFERTRPIAERLLEVRPDAIVGGSGWSETVKVEDASITTQRLDYSIYPTYQHSIGFTQRGCRLACSFCKVPRMEGRVKAVATIRDLWRGEPYPRNLLLLDNDFFGQSNWRELIGEIKDGGFKVSFNQGFNVRLIDDEQAAAIAGVRYCDNDFATRRLYTAWDNRKDESLLFRKLESLVRHGIQPRHLMVYILIGYDHAAKGPADLSEDDFHRQRRLQEFGALPYPMPFLTQAEWRLIAAKRRTPRIRALTGFQRWVVGSYARRGVAWKDFEAAHYQPRGLGQVQAADLFA